MKQPAFLLASQCYPFWQWYQQNQKKLDDHLDEAFGFARSIGLNAWEHSVNHPGELEPVKKLADKHGLAMPSVYVGPELHKPDAMEVAQRHARDAKGFAEHGIRIIVNNPPPINWGSKENKDDVMLRRQAKALDYLGAAYAEAGIRLAYHMHDPEFRAGAREIHHMMVNTDPANVALCLDTHWIYRGCGNSQAALEDFIKMYGDRIVSLHVRQSRDGIWSACFGEGDIDYTTIVAMLRQRNLRPLIALEQCTESGTGSTPPPPNDDSAATGDSISPQTKSNGTSSSISWQDCQRESVQYAMQVFAPLFESATN